MTEEWCSVVPQGIRLMVHILPNAKKNDVVGIFDHLLKIRIQAQPVEGRANEALIRYVAGRLHLPKSAVTVTHGLASRRKVLEIASPHLTLNTVRSVLLPPTDH